MPLLFLPTFITHSLAVALVPSIAEAEAKKNIALIHYRIHQSIRISFASGGISTVVLSIFAVQLLTYMYGTGDASHYLVLMAPFFLLHYIQSPLQAALQALDLAKPAMWNSLFGVALKSVVLVILASNPNFGIMGAAIGLCTGVVLVTLLHLAVLRKVIGYSIPFLDICKMIVLLAFTWLFGSFLKRIYETMEPHVILFLSVLVILGAIYIILLFALKFITKDELRQIPFFNKKK